MYCFIQIYCVENFNKIFDVFVITMIYLINSTFFFIHVNNEICILIEKPERSKIQLLLFFLKFVELFVKLIYFL